MGGGARPASETSREDALYCRGSTLESPPRDPPEVHPHLARHFAAKLHLTEHPGDYGSLRLVEGHKSVETLTRSYCGTETVAAIKHYDEHILKLRERHSAPLRRLPLRRAPSGGF